jgi:hypothetical protein
MSLVVGTVPSQCTKVPTFRESEICVHSLERWNDVHVSLVTTVHLSPHAGDKPRR